MKEKRRLRAVESKVLRKIFGLTKDDVTGKGDDYITRSFKICIPHQALFGWSNQEELTRLRSLYCIVWYCNIVLLTSVSNLMMA